MTGLTHSIPPDVLDPANHALLTGDPTDDDAAVIDETFEAGPTEPQEYSGVKPAKDELPKATRILQRRIAIGTDANAVLADPVPLFPADPKRKSISISLDALTAFNSPKTYRYIVQSNVSYTNPVGTTDLPAITIPVGSLVYTYLRANTINGGGNVSLSLTEQPGPTGGNRTISTSGTIAVGGNSNTNIPTSSIPSLTDTITPHLIWSGTVTDATIDVAIVIIPPAGYKYPALVVIGSDKSDCYSGTVYDIANGVLTLTDHTGAVWVYSPTNAVINVNAWSVTE